MTDEVRVMKKLLGLVVLVLGVLLLLRDLNVWDFWAIQPWTLAFLLAGLVISIKSCCWKGKKK